MQTCIQQRLLRTAAFSTCSRCRLPRHDTSKQDPSSNRTRKRRRIAPSGELIRALDPLIGPALRPSAYSDRPNYSYTNPIPGPPRLQEIVACVITQHASSSSADSTSSHRNNGSSLPNSPSSLSRSALEVLAAKKYRPSDVDHWVAILMEPDLTLAARALRRHTFGNLDSEQPPKPIPLFVLLFLLRRNPGHVFPMAIVHLLPVIQHELQRRDALVALRNGTLSDSSLAPRLRLEYPVIEKDSLFLVIIRLLRYARRIWPQALPSVVSTFIQSFSEPNPKHAQQKSRHSLKKYLLRLRALTHRSNKLLSLLSLPTSKAPFRHITHCRAAQFHVLEFMINHKPPLTISRMGFQAVIRLHLASSKTERDREWDQLKAKSWPPWKEDKTGLDAEKDANYALPSSFKAMRHLARSGYPFTAWEKVAQVLAGWDLDGSPTIQTRSIILNNNLSHATMPDISDKSPEIWAARIRSTRTVQEAWAAFMAHRDRALPPSSRVYFAMLEKLAATNVENSIADRTSIDSLLRPLDGGDSKETFPIPESPKEATYVRLPPPTLHQLARDMFTDELFPGHRTLTLLIANADNLEQAIMYIRIGSKRNPEVDSLLSEAPSHDPRLQLVPRSLLAVFLALLWRTDAAQRHGRESSGTQAQYFSWREHPIVHAKNLLQAYQHRDVVLYNHIMSCFVEHGPRYRKTSSRALNESTVLESSLIEAAETIGLYQEVDQLFHEMETDHVAPDTETFRLMCKSLSFLVLATQELEHNPFSTSYSRHSPNELTQLIRSRYASRTHALFNQVFHGDDDSIASTNAIFPQLLSEPGPAILHTYIRLLGHLHDYIRMLHLARWMSRYRNEIDAIAAEARNGKKMLRNCHLAFRAFTEPEWADTSAGAEADDRADSDEELESAISKSLDFYSSSFEPAEEHRGELSTSEIVGERLRILVEAAGWEWPSDEEVEAYVDRGNVGFESTQMNV